MFAQSRASGFGPAARFFVATKGARSVLTKDLRISYFAPQTLQKTRVPVKLLQKIRSHWALLAYIALSMGILGWVAWDAFCFRLITYGGGVDYWEHTAAFYALLENLLDPRNPHVVSEASSPRFGPHFVLIAAFGKLIGVDAIDAMAIAAVLNTLLLLLGIYCFFRTYFRDARAPLYGLIVMFGSWLDAPYWSNVYKLSVYFSVAGYPSNAALALTLLGLYLTLELLRGERRRPGLLALSCVMWAYIYITHPLTAMMSFTAALALAATEPTVSWERQLEIGGTVVGGLVLAAIWPYYPALGMVVSGTTAKIKEGLAAGPSGQALHFFYAPSTLLGVGGVALLALPVLPYLAARRELLFVIIGILVMLGLFIVNLFLPIPLGHRFVLLAVFFLQVALVWVMLQLTPVGPKLPDWASQPLLRWGAALGVIALLLYCTGSNVASAMARFEERTSHEQSWIVRYGRRVGVIAGSHGVIFGLPKPSWPIPTFGPRVVTLFHANPLVADAKQRRQDSRRFFAQHTSDNERSSILARYGATHVLSDKDSSNASERFLKERGNMFQLPGGLRLYALRGDAGCH